jgi:hypothetical protein
VIGRIGVRAGDDDQLPSARRHLQRTGAGNSARCLQEQQDDTNDEQTQRNPRTSKCVVMRGAGEEQGYAATVPAPW